MISLRQNVRKASQGKCARSDARCGAPLPPITEGAAATMRGTSGSLIATTEGSVGSPTWIAVEALAVATAVAALIVRL